ncbi:MAG: TIGR03088 family PEP-CTERM/XrtA system glycosyltransferase [Gammaproteobacteria bacterium]|nr:TIGR03088 family PEP-CTERM/XrtA system glycosyltransferase [Gammaproteobacteria bacterium]
MCHIIFRLDFGGLENGLVNLLNNMPEQAFSHQVICLESATEFRKRIRRDDIPVFEMHKRPGKDLAMYGRIWRLLRKLKPDIVHTRNIPTLDMLPVAWAAGIRRLVHSEHGLDFVEMQGNHKRYNQLRRLSRFFASQYITVSDELAGWLKTDIGIPADRITAIHNGVDTAKFARRKTSIDDCPAGFDADDTIVVGTIGRSAKIKAQSDLARAFVLLVQRQPHYRERLRLAIIGDGEERPAVIDLLREQGLSDLCWLPGYRNDTDQVYNLLDLFVLPSLREGISNTILEAMASGLPVIATRVGGNPEIVTDGVTGTLVEPADPAALADAIEPYIEDPDRLARHGQAGLDQAQTRFSLAAMVRQYSAVYARA